MTDFLDESARRILGAINVDSTTILDLRDLPFVRKAMINVSYNWFNIGINLRVAHNKLDDIKKKYRNESESSLNAVLAEWLKNYNSKYGHPTWFSVVATIASRIGGDNPAEAKRIAENYRSGLDENIPEAKNTDNRPLASTDLPFVVAAIIEGVAVQWMSIGLLLGVSYETLQICEATQGLEEHVNGMVVAWLTRKYDWERFGEPTWRRLVEIIGARAGGNHRGLSQKIAKQHPIMARGDSHQPAPSRSTAEVSPFNTATVPPPVAIPLPLKPFDALSERDLSFLMNALRSLASRWLLLGQQLNISMGDLNNISAKPMLLHGAPLTFLQDMLYVWVSHEPPSSAEWPTLGALCEALRSAVMDEATLALELDQQFNAHKGQSATGGR